jgi:hypothetical protein
VRLPLYQRVANRLGRPLGIMPFAFANPLPLHVDNGEEIFDRIYATNYWGSAESASGSGSEIARTERYRRVLQRFLLEKSITSMFDAPCGDLNWMRLVLREYPMRYVGGDISSKALESARANFPGCDVRLFDLRFDAFPDVQLWHCRDALFHMSFEDVWRTLENAARSKVQYALLTSHRSRWLKNIDIETGSWRHLDIEKPPFNVPPAQRYLEDSSPGEFPRAVGVWSTDILRLEVAKRAKREC